MLRKSLLACVAMSVFVMVALTLVISGASAADPIDPARGPGGNDPLLWHHSSMATLQETIGDLGGGQYLYSYVLTNGDTAGIWHFGVYTRWETSAPTALSMSSWISNPHRLSDTTDQYVATNVDPNLTYVATSWGPNWYPTGISSNPLGVGSSASGFSFIMSVYDPTPKLFFYELQGEYAYNSQYVAAVGYTTAAPEPSSLLSLLTGVGGLGGLMWRRRK
jgi:hypothetical protein